MSSFGKEKADTLIAFLLLLLSRVNHVIMNDVLPKCMTIVPRGGSKGKRIPSVPLARLHGLGKRPLEFVCNRLLGGKGRGSGWDGGEGLVL